MTEITIYACSWLQPRRAAFSFSRNKAIYSLFYNSRCFCCRNLAAHLSFLFQQAIVNWRNRYFTKGNKNKLNMDVENSWKIDDQFIFSYFIDGRWKGIGYHHSTLISQFSIFFFVIGDVTLGKYSADKNCFEAVGFLVNKKWWKRSFIWSPPRPPSAAAVVVHLKSIVVWEKPLVVWIICGRRPAGPAQPSPAQPSPATFYCQAAISSLCRWFSFVSFWYFSL